MGKDKVSELSHVVSKHIEKDHALVIYRRPEETLFKLMAGPWHTSAKFENSGKDQFVLSPFTLHKHPRFVITPDLQIGMDHMDIDFDFGNVIPHIEKAENGKNFTSLVEKGIAKIKKGDFDKVVLSRAGEISIDDDFNPISFLDRLSSAYPECFCFFILIPYQTCWIGATPELLANADSEGRFKTVSLAGTLPAETLDRQCEWTSKEKEEQQYVSEYIIEALRKNGIENLDTTGPETIKTGNLFHLKTTFETPPGISDEQFMRIVEELHPTPAVCGTPKSAAIEFIEEFEGYDRSYYSGYLGKIAQNGEASLFVNLRSMQLFKNKAILYAGAGITADSIPQKEFEETERKMDALRRLIDA